MKIDTLNCTLMVIWLWLSLHHHAHILLLRAFGFIRQRQTQRPRIHKRLYNAIHGMRPGKPGKRGDFSPRSRRSAIFQEFFLQGVSHLSFCTRSAKAINSGSCIRAPPKGLLGNILYSMPCLFTAMLRYQLLQGHKALL